MGRDAARDPAHPAHALHKRSKDNHMHAEMADMTRPVTRFIKPIRLRIMRIPSLLRGNPLPGKTINPTLVQVPNGKPDDGKCCKVKPAGDACCDSKPKLAKDCCKDPAKSSCAHT